MEGSSFTLRKRKKRRDPTIVVVANEFVKDFPIESDASRSCSMPVSLVVAGREAARYEAPKDMGAGFEFRLSRLYISGDTSPKSGP